MKTYFVMMCVAGLVAAVVDGCSSDDDKATLGAIDAGSDGSPTVSGGDDDIEPGCTTFSSTLTQCVCNAVGSVNANKPACGCPGVTGQIGSGPQVGAVGGKFVSGAIDTPGGRLVMGVQSIQGGSLWTVDLKTGNRVIVSGTVTDTGNNGTAKTTGTGDPMGSPTAVRIGTDGWYTFEGTTASKQIQKVDPATGARTTLLTTNQMTSTTQGGHPIKCTGASSLDTAFALPEAGMGLGPANEIYVAMGHAPGYVAIAKITGGAAPTCTIVTGDNYDVPAENPVGSGPSFNNINSVDFANGRLYVLDVPQESLFAVDPSSGARALVSAPSPIDAGTKIKDAGYDASDADAGYDAAGGNGTGQITPSNCFTDETQGSNVFAFTSATQAWTGTSTDSAHDVFTNINLSNGVRGCFALTVPCHADQTNGQAIDLTVGVFPSPTANMVLTAGPTQIWTVDTTNHAANVISE